MMALLPEAIRAGGQQTARHTLQDGTAVIVQRITGREGPFDQEGYLVRVRRPGRLPEERFAADDLLEAVERLRAWRLPGFDPDTADWRPTSGVDMLDPESPDAPDPTGPVAHQGAGEEKSPSVS